jgi:very-short-patch-repair endonuclease
VAELAARQHGVVSRAQLRRLGVTDTSIAKAVRAGHLHPSFRGVFGVGHPRRQPHSRMLAAVLACGPGTVVSHRTAAALLGLSESAPVTVDVIAPGQSGRGINGIRRHHVPPPHGNESGTCIAVPCTSPSRTIADLAGTIGKQSLRRVVERAAVLRLLDVSAIEHSLAAQRRRGAPVLRAILSEWHVDRPGETPRKGQAPFLRSELEARVLALIAASDLPAPGCNRKLVVDGAEIEVDFLWPEQQLVVEADGRGFHDNPLPFERDRARDRALQLSGYRVVRVTHAQIKREPDAVIAAVHRLLISDFG